MRVRVYVYISCYFYVYTYPTYVHIRTYIQGVPSQSVSRAAIPRRYLREEDHAPEGFDRVTINVRARSRRVILRVKF